MIAVIDYGVGNLFSLRHSLEFVGAEATVSGEAAVLRQADKLILPGVGAFGDAAQKLRYTGLDQVTGEEPPTYCCVGTSDGIASYRTMEERVRRIRANGTDAEIEVFRGLPHGFGLGEGTVAEGWIDHAIAFWQRQMTA